MRVRLSALPPYPLASLLALLLASGTEALLTRAPAPLTFVASLAGFCITLGALHGLLWQIGLAAAARLPRRWALAVWWPAAIGGAVWLADALGVLGRLSGRYEKLAWATAAACVGGAVLVGLLMMGLQPTERSPAGRLARLGWPMRSTVVVVLLAATGGLAYADRTLYVGLYMDAHIALRVCALWASMVALALVLAPLAWTQLGKIAWAVALGAILVPLATLREETSSATQAFVVRPWAATMLRSARGLVDFDRDGFSMLFGGGDCNDFNPNIHPKAREIPGNGIDDNCMFGDRVPPARRPSEVAQAKGDSPLNVVLITIDTLRWDRFGLNDAAYGEKGRNTMPKLSRWARKAVNFQRAYTAGGWTSISLGAMMRGMYARRLSWTAYYETTNYRLGKRRSSLALADGERIAKMFPLAWNDPRPPLPFWLKRRGMKTIAVLDDGFSQMLAGTIGVREGFDVFREISPDPDLPPEAFAKHLERYRKQRVDEGDATTATTAISTLRYSAKGHRFFMWVHFFGPHTPSLPHREVPSYGDSLQDGYDHEIRYLDLQLDRVLREINKIEEPTAVFVTSDHGEQFLDRYRSHGKDLAEDNIRVPMLARVPGWKPRTVTAPVSLIDLMPTILALTHTPAPPDLDGIDISGIAQGQPAAPRVMLADTWQYNRDGQDRLDLAAAFDGSRKIVLDRRNHGTIAQDQTYPDAEPLRLEGLAVDRLVRSVLTYIEETGGALSLAH